MIEITKYHRTRHLEGSRLQHGDHDLTQVPFYSLRGVYIVGEEKLDGANAGISFGPGREQRLQCRGHYLTGGSRYEAQFDLLKPWASVHSSWLWEALDSRYILFGEWLYAKHTIYYDALPHYFIAFAVWDRQEQKYLSEELRRMMFDGAPLIWAPVLHRGELVGREQVEAMIQPTPFKTANWREHLLADAEAAGYRDPMVALRETDQSDLMEGVYFYTEKGDYVTGLMKWVRTSFMSAILDSESHWADRQMIPNRLAEGVDLFAF